MKKEIINLINSHKRLTLWLTLLVIGSLVFILGIGSTGLVDETPPLFAASARSMPLSGDWITPKVNGIFRFDKPPLIYWLMGFFYSLPGNEIWDKFGTISARLPSALSAVVMMIMIGDTIFCWPQKNNKKVELALVASISFALSPLVIIWSRTAVSDSLLCGTIGMSLLLFWRRMASANDRNCTSAWIFLGLAILTKGPVAFVIVFLTLILFLASQKNWKPLLKKINPFRGFLITLLISLPWYVVVLIKEGSPFWDSFFGYHNIQRYTSVVNNHADPWGFFIFIMIISSLPFSAFLLDGIYKASKEIILDYRQETDISDTLYIFSLCWLLGIFVFFGISATKLPSYWLPAIPAAAILISKSALSLKEDLRKTSFLWLITTLILFGLCLPFYFSNNWLDLINDPEMPNLAKHIEESGLLIRSRILFSIMTIISLSLLILKSSKSIIYLQSIFLLGVFLIMPPVRKLTDISRQLPIREISIEITSLRKDEEPLVMIGIRKPSLHFYSKQIVFFESNTPEGMINLSERFQLDRRSNILDTPNYESDTFLVVIDKYSNSKEEWNLISYETLGKYGIYNLIRVERSEFENYVDYLRMEGYLPTWETDESEKF